MKTLSLCLCVAFLALAGCGREQPVPPEQGDSPPRIEAGTALLSEDSAHKAGVELSTAGPAMLRETITVYGSIQAEPDRVRTVTARFPGVVRSVVHQIGDHVAAGQTLATVESNESLQVYPVISPISGVITQRRTNAGEIAGTEALFEVADFGTVRAELSVFPKDRAHLKPGQKATIRGSERDLAADGSVSYVAPLGNSQNQSIAARIVLPNRDARWTPGQFVTAEIATSESQAAVAVVPSAIQQIKGRSVVFVQTPSGFEARQVELARRGLDVVEIGNGLKAGERYVSKNSYLVKAEVLKSEAEE